MGEHFPKGRAFFRTMPGMSAFLYGLFSVAEFVGRSLGGVVQYRVRIPDKKKYGFAFFVYQFYEVMDMCLLWLPYPLMLLNRASAGFLGVNSATMRQAAVQRYLPEGLRARINAFESMCIMAASSLCSLGMGALGEVLDVRVCVTLGAAFTLVVCWLTIWKNRAQVRQVYQPGRD